MDLEQRAAALGVELGYEDYQGEPKQSPEDSVRRVLEALEEDASPARDRHGPLVLRRGDRLPFDRTAMVETEDGEQHAVDGALPDWMPFGYHTVHGDDGSTRRLIVSPGACYLPEGLRIWGWALQLYGLRSANSWGIGDLGDLTRFNSWTAAHGAGTVMINPLGAATPGRPMQPSPYYPSSRSFRNPVFLDVDALEGADHPDLIDLRGAARRLNEAPLIDRNAAWKLKEQALEILFRRDEPADLFDRFCEGCGDFLEDFATFCALAEQNPGAPWDWPAGLQGPDSSGVDAFRRGNDQRIRFHKWLQWQLDRQLDSAGSHLPLLQDLPVGIDPGGADAWIWGNAFAEGFELGAPPDEFNRAGQSWGIAGFHPRRLREAGYEPFLQMIRSQMAHAGGLRIDHVMGLFRLYWIPKGCDPSEGVYVRYPADELLDIVALESHRAQAFVVGEDLGTVEPGVREKMAERKILSYRLLIFEDDPDAVPEDSMAAVTTHDLPTIGGIWTGSDLKAQKALGLPANEEGMEQMVDRLAEAAGVPASEALTEVVPAVHRKLAACPARIVLATVEDATGVVDRPNMPGVQEGWPNWSLPLPETLEEIMESPPVERIVQVLREARPRLT
ncbi:MAG TPA: 4-alpha-glucanotransferase [Actinomycetota bacterium]|nr:4-alpha-glucanotransferase [Actinomycetota bacterium]